MDGHSPQPPPPPPSQPSLPSPSEAQPPLMVVAAAVIRTYHPEPQVLLQKRDRNAVFWELPGGKVDIDETPVQAVCRELREEVDIWVPEGAP